MRKRVHHGVRILSAPLLIWANLVPLCAQAGDRTIGQFVHTAWSAKEGAPGNVYALAQTTDGFLWLGTMQGLYRFDGVSFERYEPRSGPAFQSSNVTALLALPNGDLWIGYRDKGVSRLRNGTNTNYTGSDGLPSGRVTRLAQDREGTIWAAANGGLARFENDRCQRIGHDWGYPGDTAATLYVDRRGTLLVASERALVFLPEGSRKFQTTGIEIGVTYQMVESPSGALWMAETSKSVHPVILPANRHHNDEPEIKVGSAGILFNDDGSLWITSLGDGMRRVSFPDRLNGQKIGEFSNAIESFTARDGLTSDYARCILKDREGNIWAGTSAGLDRFRKGALVPILLPAKFALKTLVPGDHGDIWVGGLSLALAHIEGNTWKNVHSSASSFYGLRDSQGVIWFLTLALRVDRTAHYGISQLHNGEIATVADMPPEVRPEERGAVLAEDRAGRVWLGAGQHNLFFLKNGRWERFETPPEVVGKRAQVSFTDAGGRVWFGFSDNTVLMLDGTNVRTFSEKDGVHVGSVTALIGRDRHIWIGGGDGLAVWEGDRFRAVLPADGDAFHGVSGVQEDSDGDLFLGEQRGVVFISATEILKVLKDPSARTHYQIFDTRDGLPGAVQQSSPYPTAAQGADGRIWFSASTGVARIDPTHIQRNPLAPPVVIRSMTANGTRYTSPDGLRLPPRTRDLTIDYTALSLAVPDRVRFRYKLEGSDTQWQEAGTRRQAFYTNLSPREYRFRVTASNNDGVWNDTGASWTFSIAPTFYQTLWFQTLMALAGGGLIWVLYRLRLRQITARADLRYAGRLEERTRIARELHDTLLQSFQGVLMQFDATTYEIAHNPAEAQKKLEAVVRQARQAVTEGRNAVEGLRSSVFTDDLARALGAIGEELAANPVESCPTFCLRADGVSRDLAPLVRDEILRIAGEAIRNSFVHSQGARAEVQIHYEQRQFRLVVRDNGKGIDPKFSMQAVAPGTTAFQAWASAPHSSAASSQFAVSSAPALRSSSRFRRLSRIKNRCEDSGEAGLLCLAGGAEQW
jgi:ligand-binding sensor domain-containing protein